jgi:hypothetical protein
MMHENDRLPDAAPASRMQLREALRRAASALKEHGPRSALAGSYALWAYGAPEPSHDVDIVVAESDVEAAAATIGGAGFSVEHPPEDWLFKARAVEGAEWLWTCCTVSTACLWNRQPWTARNNASPGDRDAGAAADRRAHPKAAFARRGSLRLGVAAPSGACDQRALDWDLIKAQTADSDFAVAFLVLAGRLGLID